VRIFVLLSRIPWPLEKGDKLRAFNQVKQLAATHEIILCALNTDRKADKQMAFKALQPYCRSVNFIDLPMIGIVINLIKAWFTGKPMQLGYFYNARVQRKIDKLIDEYQPDVIYGQLLRVAEYIRFQSVVKAIDYQDVFSMGMKRRYEIAGFFKKPFFYAEYQRLKRYENAIFADFDIKTIISEPDRQHIDHPKRNEILIVPNGVDHEYFKPMTTEKKYDLVFTGNMAYAPNVNAAQFLANEIMPLVWEKLPQATLLLAGATPDKAVRGLASDRITVSGWLDDIRVAYAGSRVFIAPMRIGTGLQNKLLEAMSMKIPCVTTLLANNALNGKAGIDLLVGETTRELADAVTELLTNAAKADEIGASGFRFVNDYYDWKAATKTLLQAISSLTNASY
jgi:sugar transferase (PEP-CTERM/EpsH1 system associated)